MGAKPMQPHNTGLNGTQGAFGSFLFLICMREHNSPKITKSKIRGVAKRESSQLTIDTGLIPAPTRKSTNTDFNLVWPDLKSSPAMKTPLCSANSRRPVQPSAILAMAKMVEGEISDLLAFKDSSNSCMVIFKPGLISLKRSVLAVHRTKTESKFLLFLKS
ncbi:hypothetical protein FF38_02213 [Lucilia cuprina]|uniref:Uncharacterized protein n=1 Tax=Lucilia cuprina TaxID=7375 RepID=A0A0L0BVY6_LUCCU|nr:hypothetical protein FF38_02213 [Lucilia cuprina]